MKYSVVVPCYNEADAIETTINQILAITAHEADLVELIVVDDGSYDGSSEKLASLSSEEPRLVVLVHNQNKGYGASLKTGIRHAKGALVVITDADGTYPNHRIPALVGMCEGIDMVIGSRTGENVEYSKLRAFPKYFMRKWISWIAHEPVPDFNSGLRVMRKSVVEKFFGILPDAFSFTTTITLAMLTNKFLVRFEPIDYTQRIGDSKISPFWDTLRFIALILRTGVYFAPMRVFGPVVAGLFLLGCGSLLYDALVLNNLTDKSVILLLFSLNMGGVTLLADMIDKRCTA